MYVSLQPTPLINNLNEKIDFGLFTFISGVLRTMLGIYRYLFNKCQFNDQLIEQINEWMNCYMII